MLAAGRGSRLGAIGSLTSKAALPLLGKALLTRVVETFIGVVDSVVVVVNPEDKQTLSLITQTPLNEIEVQIVEQRQSLGSGDALRKAWPFIDGSCIVSACDSLMPAEYIREFVRHFETTSPDALLAVGTVDEKTGLPSSSIEVGGANRIERVIEKPKSSELLSNKMALPLYAFQHSFQDELSALEISERGEYELTQAIQNLIEQGGAVFGFPAPKRVTVNTPLEYLSVIRGMLSDMHGVHIGRGVRMAPSAMIHPPVYIEKSVVIHSGASIGPDAYIMSGCVIGSDGKVQDAIVFRDSEVPGGSSIRRKIVLPGEVIDLRRSRGSHDRAHRP
ncbi:MAG: sugar phosphate nucleotidyltransferase [Anaerolineales bacterium]